MARNTLRNSVQTMLFSMASLIPCALQAAADPTFTSTAAVHDPAIVKEGNTWYVFGSHMASASSTDLMNWTQLSSSVAVGNPLVPNPFVDYSEVLTWAQTTTFWAPDVMKLPDGRFYFWYCACKGDSPRSGLGLSIATNIAGPYVNQQLMLKSGMWGLASPDGKIYDNAIHPNVVDPSVFYDKAGKLWMVYGSYSGGIFIMELDPSTGLQKPLQAYGKKLIGGNNSTIEGPTIVYSPETDYYYMFVTYGGLDAAGGYNIRVSRSRNPDGPFLDYAGNDMTNVAGRVGTFFDNDSIAPYGVKLMGNYQFVHVTGEPGVISRGYLSPGGTSVWHDTATGRYIMTIHQRFVGRGEQHEVRTYQLHLNEDGWFVAAPHRYAKEALATADTSLLAGQYKIVNHGKDITATVKYSTLVTLNGGGSVTGDSTGTWTYSGDHYMSITLGGVTYKGVFAQNWDDDSKVWVQTFSALSNTGVALWGSRVAATTANVSPTITGQPASRSITEGQSASFTVTATGTPAPTYQWKRNGVNIAGATSATYTIASAVTGDAGSYSCVVGNRVTAYFSDVATLTVAAAPGPVISTQPQNVTVTAGAAASLSVSATGTGLTYQWRKYDEYGTPQTVAGASSATLSISEATSEEAGSYDCVVTQSGVSKASSKATITVNVLMTSNAAARLVNISARSNIKSGTESTVVGFVVSGTGTETLLVRASGPALIPFGITSPVADPTMDLFNQNDIATVIAHNDNWASEGTDGLRASFVRTGAFDWPTGSNEAALLRQLNAGAYTANILPKTTTGIGLVELYEDASSGARLVNLSARAAMGSGQESLTAGFSVKGTGLKTLLIRLSGPALSQWLSGTAADPLLRLFNQNNVSVSIAQNDDWDSDTTKGNQINSVATTLQAFSWARGSADAALLVTLRAGNYTAEGTAKTAGGIALIEVYEVNP